MTKRDTIFKEQPLTSRMTVRRLEAVIITEIRRLREPHIRHDEMSVLDFLKDFSRTLHKIDPKTDIETINNEYYITLDILKKDESHVKLKSTDSYYSPDVKTS